MANSMSGDPLIMDTATANWAANALPGNQSLAVYKISWVNPTTAAHTFSITDATGQVLISSIVTATTAGGVIDLIFNDPIALSKQNGWFLSQISSGKLYIYF